MGAVVAVEGLDGAGKATLVAALAARARAGGARVTTWSFPRYDADVHAALAGEALHGAHGDTAASVHAMALLFALDRRAAAPALAAAVDAHDLVLVDRWVASNAAYGAARLHEDAEGPFVGWVTDVEVVRFGVPVPTAQVLVRVAPEVAAARVRARAGAGNGGDRAVDGFEADAALQGRCAVLYDALAARGWLAPWYVVDAAGDAGTVGRTAAEVLSVCLSGEHTPPRTPRDDTIGP